MAYREVTMLEVKEVLRLWLGGAAHKRIAAPLGLNVKTVRRYVAAARASGVVGEAGPEALDDGLIAAVVSRVQPHRGRPRGDGWADCAAQRALIERFLRQGVRLSKLRKLLRRQGVDVSYATLRRYAIAELGFGGTAATIPVADCGPGEEVQLDTGWMTLLAPDERGRRQRFRAWIFTAVLSRYRFVYPVFRETTETAIEACEAAWAFFQGVFRVLIPDNTKAIVQRADPLEPRLTAAFLEYAQARGFVIDPTRVRRARDNALAERWIRSARRECLDHVVILNECHLQRMLDDYVAYFNAWRPHQGLGQRAPCGSAPPPILHGGFPRSYHDEAAGGNGNRYFVHFYCAVTTYCRPRATSVRPAPPGSAACAGRYSPPGSVACPTRGWFPAIRTRSLPTTRSAPGGWSTIRRQGRAPAATLAWCGRALPASAPMSGHRRSSSTSTWMGNWGQGSDRKFYGTLAVEGTIAGGPVFSLGNGASAQLWSGPSTAAAAGWGFSPTYGYPLVAVVYNPVLAPPTIQPTYGPQPLTADFGPGNAQIHGIIYSGGHVQFGPLTLDGSVVAFEIRSQGGASYTYNAAYGDNTPPSGFPLGAGNRVSVIRKSFVACSSYHDESGGPTSCN